MADVYETNGILDVMISEISRFGIRGGPVTVGLSGSQGSGKSTLSSCLGESLKRSGAKVAVLSIDDFYLARNERLSLAAHVHPLLATRGVPGTHDVELAQAVIDDLSRGRVTRLPRFDKAIDDRAPESRWPAVLEPVDVIIFEGWCVGAAAEREDALVAPINSLEREHDADGGWRRFVNTSLSRAYQRLFGRLDLLAFLKAPNFDVVLEWRLEQEADLRRRTSGQKNAQLRVMSDEDVRRFVQHYERLTRHMLDELPRRADLLFVLDRERRPAAIGVKGR